MDEGLVGILIILTLALFTAIILIFHGYVRMRRNEMQHDERMLALKHGYPLPQEIEPLKNPEFAHKNAALQNRKAFVILLFLGLAFSMFFPDDGDPSGDIFGGILICLGIAFLIISTFKYKMSDEEREQFNQRKKEYERMQKRDFGEKIEGFTEVPKESEE